jgi:hypothetical protein
MIWTEFMKIYDSSITEDDADFVLWNKTAFPFSDLKMTTYQIRSAIRAKLNKVKRCDLCGYKKPFHKFNCLNKE